MRLNSSKKNKNNEPRKNLLVLIKKSSGLRTYQLKLGKQSVVRQSSLAIITQFNIYIAIWIVNK